MTQDDYILLLFNECGFDTQYQRSAWLTKEFARPIKYADELETFEKSLVINALKDIRDGKRERAYADWDESERES